MLSDYGLYAGAAILALWFWKSAYLVKEWERGVVVRLGRPLPEAKGPGLQVVWWPVEVLYKVSLAIQVAEAAPEVLITGDEKPLKVAAKCQYRVENPHLVLTRIYNHNYFMGELLKKNVYDIVRKSERKSLISSVEHANEQLRGVLDRESTDAGIRTLGAEIRVIELL